jgi:hypothetical protein
MTLRVCPICGYRYNAPENQTCGKCKGWLGGAESAAAVAAQPARGRGPVLIPRSARETLCYLPVVVGALFGFPNPIGAAFGLLMAALMLRVVRLDMERFSKGLLLGIVAAGIFFAYLIFLLIFGTLYAVLEPVIQPTLGRLIHH